MAVGESRQGELAAKLSALNTEQEERLAKRRADALHLPYVNFFGFPLEGASLALVPREEATKAGAVLFYKRGKDIRIGAVNPDAAPFKALRERLEDELGESLQVYVVSHRSLRTALLRYPTEVRDTKMETDEVLISQDQLDSFEEVIDNLGSLGERIGAVGPTEILTAALAGALKMRASDAHIEPRREEVLLRYRVDGVLQDIAVLGLDAWRQMLSRVKVLADLKLNVHTTPQDGSFVLKAAEETFDVRVSILPGGFGEYIVLRFLSRRDDLLRLEQLGMKESDRAVVMQELRESTGMILSSGPTGSGKTTTIAACLVEVNRPELKVITLEDPIEYRIKGIEQTEIDRESGYTFAVGLRSILRQDPDVIFVGEMRDAETAETSLHAAMTGHLVFSTIHANDAPGVVLRLISLGAQPYVLAPALNLVIAQRLVRLLCKHCAEDYVADQELRDHIAEVMAGVHREVFDPAVLRDSQLSFKRATGCKACGQTGYRGRTGVYELFAVKGDVEELILQGATTTAIKEAALKGGMTTIAQDAYLKVISGMTTVQEVERISEE